MALVASGAIAFSDVNVELGFSSSATIALNDAAVRALAGVASGAISLSNFYGKVNAFHQAITWTHGTSILQSYRNLNHRLDSSGNFEVVQINTNSATGPSIWKFNSSGTLLSGKLTTFTYNGAAATFEGPTLPIARYDNDGNLYFLHGWPGVLNANYGKGPFIARFAASDRSCTYATWHNVSFIGPAPNGAGVQPMGLSVGNNSLYYAADSYQYYKSGYTYGPEGEQIDVISYVFHYNVQRFLSANGTWDWGKKVNLTAGSPASLTSNSIPWCPSGGAVLASNSSFDSVFLPATVSTTSGERPFIVKYNQNGEMLGASFYTGTFSGNITSGNQQDGASPVLDSSGNLIVVYKTSQNPVMLKIDSSLNPVWGKTISDASWSPGSGIYGLAVDASDNIYLIAEIGSNAIDLMKLNSSGTPQFNYHIYSQSNGAAMSTSYFNGLSVQGSSLSINMRQQFNGGSNTYYHNTILSLPTAGITANTFSLNNANTGSTPTNTLVIGDYMGVIAVSTITWTRVNPSSSNTSWYDAYHSSTTVQATANITTLSAFTSI